MVYLKTDAPQYANDIAEEIRMFLGLVPITDTEDPDTELSLSVTLSPEQRTATARVLLESVRPSFCGNSASA